MTTTLNKAVTCPVCGAVLDRVTEARGSVEQPRAGDLGVCFGCGTALVHVADGTVREAELNDLMRLGEETRELLGRAQEEVRRMKGGR